jgi:hypothetical protein
MDQPEAALGCTECDGTSLAIASEETIQEGRWLEPESDIKRRGRAGARPLSERRSTHLLTVSD